MKRKILKYMFPITALAIVPVITSSCSGVYTTKLKQISPINWSTEKDKTTYSSLSTVNVSIKDAIYGSNFNNGNYIFLYGWTGNNTEKTLPNLLYGPNGNSGIGNIVVDMKKNLNFGSSPFLNLFFNPGTSNAQNGGIGTNNSSLGFSVSLLMFVDYAPYNGNATSINGQSGAESPLATYTQDEVLAEYNEGQTGENLNYTLENLPEEGKAKIGTYKRNDKSAIEYRELINYMKAIRPDASNTNDNYGLLAFKKGKNPQSFSIDNSTTLYESLLEYYKTN